MNTCAADFAGGKTLFLHSQIESFIILQEN